MLRKIEQTDTKGVHGLDEVRSTHFSIYPGRRMQGTCGQGPGAGLRKWAGQDVFSECGPAELLKSSTRSKKRSKAFSPC